MKSMVLTGIREMEIREIPNPEIKNSKDVLIKLKVVAVCGSDVHYYETGRIGDQVVKYPFAVGHECAGEVEAIGEEVTKVAVGDKVAIEPAMPCFKCDQCLVGRPHTCRNLTFLGCPGQAEGSLSEYIVMPETSCFPVGKNMSYDQAAISEPMAIGLYAVRKSIPMKGASIGILGFGPIGMSVLLAAKAKGAKDFYVTDKIQDRLDIANKCGAHYTGNINSTNIVEEINGEHPQGLDVVFECCGQQDAVEHAYKVLKPGGVLMLIGIPTFDFWKLPVSMGRHKEVTVINVRRQNGALEETLKLLEEGTIDIKEMPTHRFSFKNTKEAFDLVSNYKDGVMKAMIDF